MAHGRSITKLLGNATTIRFSQLVCQCSQLCKCRSLGLSPFCGAICPNPCSWRLKVLLRLLQPTLTTFWSGLFSKVFLFFTFCKTHETHGFTNGGAGPWDEAGNSDLVHLVYVDGACAVVRMRNPVHAKLSSYVLLHQLQPNVIGRR